MTVSPFLFPLFRAFDSNGDPLAGGKVYTYEPSTTTPKATYTDSTGATPNSNPVILDSAGYASIWGDGTYTLVIKDSNDVTLETVDNFNNDRGASGAAGSFQMATASGTVDAITADYANDITLADNVTVGFVSLGKNTVTNPTFSPDGLTARTIVKKGGQALSTGDIGAEGSVHFVTYSLANTRWELSNPVTITASNMTSFTPTITTSSGTVTNSIKTGFYRRVGDCMEGVVNLAFSADSSAFTNVLVEIPDSQVIDTAKIAGGGTGSVVVGAVVFGDTGVAVYTGKMIYATTTTLQITVENSSGTYLGLAQVSNTAPFTFNTGDNINLYFKVPISGWSV